MRQKLLYALANFIQQHNRLPMHVELVRRHGLAKTQVEAAFGTSSIQTMTVALVQDLLGEGG